MLEARNSKPTLELDELSSAIVHRLLDLDEMKLAKTICTYLNTGSEVRTHDVLTWAFSSSKRVLVPVVDKAKHRLYFSEVKNPDVELEKGTFGIPEPKVQYRRYFPLEEAEVILVPGLAWDIRGYRIGYGKGFYDRSINALRHYIPKIGLAYEFQIIQKLPISRYDRKVDSIVTEQRTIQINTLEVNQETYREKSRKNA
jgi:5-formyltetrahydrofolate cyclo-ligase